MKMRQVAIGVVVLALSSVQLLAQAAPAGQRSTAPRGGGARAEPLVDRIALAEWR